MHIIGATVVNMGGWSFSSLRIDVRVPEDSGQCDGDTRKVFMIYRVTKQEDTHGKN